MKNRIKWIIERIIKKALAFLFLFSLVINMTIAGWPNFGTPELGQDRLQDEGRIMQTLFATGSTFSTNPFDNTAFSGSVNGGIIDRLQWIQDKVEFIHQSISDVNYTSVYYNTNTTTSGVLFQNNTNKEVDTYNSFDTSNGRFTVGAGQAGLYRVDLWVQSNGAGKFSIYKNGSLATNYFVYTDSGIYMDGYSYIQLNEGDYITIYLDTPLQLSGSNNINDNAGITRLSILKINSTTNIRGDANLDYSTLETDTGTKWIDGKTIYRKVVNFGSLVDNTSKSVPHGLANIDTMVSSKIIAYNGSTWQNLSGADSNNRVYTNNTIVYFDTTETWLSYGYTTSYAILEYTKN